MTNPNDLAFPQTIPVMAKSSEFQGALEKVGEQFIPGLTKREYFAAIAMQGMIAGSQGLQITVGAFASQAVKLADALIVELSK